MSQSTSFGVTCDDTADKASCGGRGVREKRGRREGGRPAEKDVSRKKKAAQRKRCAVSVWHALISLALLISAQYSAVGLLCVCVG